MSQFSKINQFPFVIKKIYINRMFEIIAKIDQDLDKYIDVTKVSRMTWWTGLCHILIYSWATHPKYLLVNIIGF
jgi:hypothetical protein